MSDPRLWFMLDALGLVTLTATLFFVFGWWMKSRTLGTASGSKASSTDDQEMDHEQKAADEPPANTQVSDERQRFLETELYQWKARASGAEQRISDLKTDLSSEQSAHSAIRKAMDEMSVQLHEAEVARMKAEDRLAATLHELEALKATQQASESEPPIPSPTRKRKSKTKPSSPGQDLFSLTDS
jgi:chromosome segregation ATPase